MSTNGPTRTFSEAEIQKFKPVFLKLVQKQIDLKQAAREIGKSDFDRFKLYYKVTAACLKVKQADQKLENLQARKEILHKHNQEMEGQIEASRNAASQETSGKLNTVTVKHNF